MAKVVKIEDGSITVMNELLGESAYSIKNIF